MLSELFIQNLAVIEKTNIQFPMGLTVFTGETGAGKSIVIDAINAILGRKITRESIRSGSEKAVISAVFTEIPEQVQQLLTEMGYDLEEGELIIQREISADSKSSARICGRPATVTSLRNIGDLLINIHGQHDNQLLLSSDTHIDLLDSFGGYSDQLEKYQKAYREYQAMEAEIRRLTTDEKEKAHRQDLLTFQVNELEQAALSPGEDEELEAERNLIRNSEKVFESLQQAYLALTGNEEFSGAADLLGDAGKSMIQVSEYMQDTSELSDKVVSASYEVEEMAEEIRGLIEDFEFNPAQLEMIEERLDEIHKLKRKYGTTIEEILAYFEQAKQELEEYETSDERLNQLLRDQNKVKQKLMQEGETLSALRKKAAEHFVETVSGELKFLDMPNVVLHVELDACPLNAKGAETVTFLMSTNLGEPPKPISKIASGGELSRIMLAIKNTLAGHDHIMTSIFDEIDTGVSGRAAQKIGLKLKQAAKGRQVICVTHSAQIAALADHHCLIEKSTKNGRTFTQVRPLDFEGRKQEVARIMGTDKITDLMLENAEQMIRMGMER